MHSIHRVVPTALFAAIGALCAHGALAQGLSVGLSGGSYGYEIETSAGQVWSGESRSYTLNTDYGFAGGTYIGLALTKVAEGTLDFTFQGTPGTPDQFKRQDTALTLGHAFGNSISTFVGYKSARTEVATGLGTEFKTAGVFIGMAYPLNWGSNYLTFSGAVGFNRASWTDSTAEVKDSAIGYSGGVKYGYALGSVLLGVGAKFQRYAYDFTQIGYGTLDETIKAVDLSVSYSF
jgi:hypothetical protein